MNERVAFGDDLNHFPQENTTILNSKFLILNSLDRALNRNLILNIKRRRSAPPFESTKMVAGIQQPGQGIICFLVREKSRKLLLHRQGFQSQFQLS